ncbi:hypothetical protein [Rhodovulum euryhalinum]|uniref:hypothetical protein n=1 Tax=Rhodovulum euryhalinum TaxID=35805 RepID=UPI00104845C2|nr:hypothetical protein [Rhodovulum euryhalinum]
MSLLGGLGVYAFWPWRPGRDGIHRMSRGAAVVGPDLMGLFLVAGFTALPFWIGRAEGQAGLHGSAWLLWPMALGFGSLLVVGWRNACFGLRILPDGLEVHDIRGIRTVPRAEILVQRPWRRGLPGWMRVIAPLLPPTAAGAILLARDSTGVTLDLVGGGRLNVPAEGFEPGIKALRAALARTTALIVVLVALAQATGPARAQSWEVHTPGEATLMRPEGWQITGGSRDPGVDLAGSGLGVGSVRTVDPAQTRLEIGIDPAATSHFVLALMPPDKPEGDPWNDHEIWLGLQETDAGPTELALAVTRQIQARIPRPSDADLAALALVIRPDRVVQVTGAGGRLLLEGRRPANAAAGAAYVQIAAMTRLGGPGRLVLHRLAPGRVPFVPMGDPALPLGAAPHEAVLFDAATGLGPHLEAFQTARLPMAAHMAHHGTGLEIALPAGQGSGWLGLFSPEAVIWPDRLAGGGTVRIGFNGDAFDTHAGIGPDGALRVDKPAGQDWPRSGILSAEPVTRLDDRLHEAPFRLALSLDPKGTDGVEVMLGADPVPDMARSAEMRLRLVRLDQGLYAGAREMTLTHGFWNVWTRRLAAPAAALACLACGQAGADAFSDRPLRPKVDDLGAYRPETRAALERLTAAQPDRCVANVASSLFLDAHLVETGLMEKFKSVGRPGEAMARIVTIFALPDAAGIGGNIASVLGYASVGAALNLVSVGQNSLKSYDVLVEHTIGSLEQRRAIQTQEIVQKSIDYRWDPTLVSDRSRQLADRSQGIVSQMQDLGDRTEILRVESDFKEELKRLDKQKADRTDALREALGGKSDLSGSGRLAVIKKEYKDGEAAAVKSRDAKLTEIAARYEREVGKLTEDLARNATQHEALARHAWPIANGTCAEIARDGKAPVVPKLPTGLDEPYARDADDAARLAQVLAPPHDKLMIVLDALVLDPPADYLSCVCRAAAYGTLQTIQMYHPDTLGEYDPRYYCTHPGDPCIVQGHGCLRFPMPTDPALWDRCAARSKDEAGYTVTDAILSRMKAQRSRFQETDR